MLFRLLLALLLLAALVWLLYRLAELSPGQRSPKHTGSIALSRQEALDILGLPDEADTDQILAAHKRLIQKLHPDRGGSDYLAVRINAAKQRLLNQP